jgi:hypothetical protein
MSKWKIIMVAFMVVALLATFLSGCDDDGEEEKEKYGFPREEIEEMVRRFLDANKKAEAEGDWKKHLTPFYTEDAEHTVNAASSLDEVARGRDEISDWVLGTAMEGLEGWTYPYQQVLIDETKGEVVGFWKQIAPGKRPDGSNYEVAGMGVSWFGYAGNYQWSWQKDFLDIDNVVALILELGQAGLLSDEMKEKIRTYMEGS